MRPTVRRLLRAGYAAPILVDMSENFGRFTYPDVTNPQVDLANLLASPTYGGYMPAGVQEWQVQNATKTTGNLTDFNYNTAGANNPLTATGYTPGNTGKTPFLTVFPNTTTGIGGATGTYSWQYRCRVNGGKWSNWATYTRVMVSDACSFGDGTGNFPGSLFYFYGSGADAYSIGIRTLLIPCGLARPDIRMGGSFNFASGTGYSSANRMKVMWANNQKPPTLSAIAWTSASGVLIDLEYDGVTVTRGRLVGANANVNAKIQLSNCTDCKVVRCDLRNTPSDYTAEYVTGPAPPSNAWACIAVSGTGNYVGTDGVNGDANYLEHAFYGVYVSGTGHKVCNNSIANMHGRHVGHDWTAVDTQVSGNMFGPVYRTQVPVLDVGNHLDLLWAQDGPLGPSVNQNPNWFNNVFYPGASNSAARVVVFGATDPTLAVATPKGRGNLILHAYTYPYELSRWSGRARITHNTTIMLAGVGSYATAPVGAKYDESNLGSRIRIAPATALPGGADLELDKNYAWNDIELDAVATAALVGGGSNYQNLRAAGDAGFHLCPGNNPQTYLQSLPASTFDPPTSSAQMSTLLGVLWTACARNDGYGAVNSTGTGWATLPP